MKKRLFALTVLLSGVLCVSPINGVFGDTEVSNDIMYANTSNNKYDSNKRVEQPEISEVADDEDKNENFDKTSINIESNYNTSKEYNSKKYSNKDINNNSQNKKVTENFTNERITENVERIQNSPMTRESAVESLNVNNKEIEYEYMGDENTFNVLKEKGHEGYVFLPKNVPTDLGVFVNKNTNEKYYFHPSGYLDLYE
ncbi:hypothetical protein [Peptostreptococcus canis]|uniref:Uncharacterized protein n=1 Tax=Peptostreptococcus canis TaxID=1159213 RepID=A0ABR6TKL7_9FIRM|nr:hypothetical protein [Peptostreptococcus canis]MBC2575783.1 hypothetical protein [Peptostreptococcus canis]MBP1998102.1 hypothetical protein [Peptostreptococcus canis]